MTLAEFTALVEAKAQDVGEVKVYDTTRGLSSANLISELITDSIDELSDYAPQTIIEDFIGTGVRYYNLSSILTGWPAIADEDNAEVNRLWLDLSDSASSDRDDDELPVKYWTVDHWLFSAVQSKALIFRGAFFPSSGDIMRVEYYINQTFPGSGAISLETKHVDAFSDLVAGKYLLKALASKMIQNVKNTPVSDALTPLNPVRTVQSAAQILIDKFYEHFGDDPREPGGKKLRQWMKASDKTGRHWIYARGG